jgi:hypothetical protein
MWSEISNIDYDQAVRSTAWYDIVSRRRDQDLERELCQAASGRLWQRPTAWLARWLAAYQAARQGRSAKRKELEWAHRTMVL